jgi:uncharacterized membrane protein
MTRPPQHYSPGSRTASSGVDGDTAVNHAALPSGFENGERILIWPHRSLGLTGTRIVLGIAAAGLFGSAAWVAQPAAMFVLVPASVVFASLIAAFRINARRGLYIEIIDISADTVRVMTSHLGLHRLVGSFDPYWMRIELRDDGRIEKRLILQQSGRAVSVGECLSPPEREDLAAALRDHIARARSPSA